MDQPHHEIIIIKKGGESEEEGHHGGAWKIAFADFMTAMMAFFLVLWIINATSKDTKTVIARYFNPVKLEDPAKAKKGIVQSSATSEVTAEDEKKQSQASSAPSTAQPSSTSPGQLTAASPPSENAPMKGPAMNPSGVANSSSKADEEKTKAALKEDALFADPYASLDRIASAPSATAQPADAPRAPAQAITDPFRPITLGSAQDLDDGTGSGGGGQAGAVQAQQSPQTSPSSEAAGPPSGAGGRLSAPSGDSSAAGVSQQSAPAAQAASPIQTAPAAANLAHSQSPASGPAEAALTPDGQSSQKSAPEEKAAVDAKPLGAEKSPASDYRAKVLLESKDVARQLQKDMDTAASDAAPTIRVEASDDGLLISVTDKMNFSMFSVGSAEPDKRTLKVMDDIAKVLKSEPGSIVVRGFTDARPFHSLKYDNWRLSSARAQMAYYMLVRGGIPDGRFERIEGYGDKRLKDSKNPLAPINRRIEILVKPEK